MTNSQMPEVPPSFAPTRRTARPGAEAPNVAVVPGHIPSDTLPKMEAIAPIGSVPAEHSVRRQSVLSGQPKTPVAYVPGQMRTPASHQPVTRRGSASASPAGAPVQQANPPAVPPTGAPPAVIPASIPPASYPPGNYQQPVPVVRSLAQPQPSYPSAQPGYAGIPQYASAPPQYPGVQYPGQQLQGQQPQGQQFPGQQYPSQQVLGQQAPGGQYPGVHYSPAAGYAPAAQPNANYSFPPGQYDDGGAHLAGTKPLKRKRRKGPIVALVLVLLLLAVLAYPVGLIMWANGQINHIEALSGRANTPGTTFLLVGTDTRGDDDIYHELDLVDGTTGSRADSVILLHQPRSGPTAMISLPRDTFVQIPGVGGQKLNAAYAFGGPELLVATVENLTGLTIDHFVGIGMGGLANLVDAVGGVELCMDRDVDDWESQLVWEAGCHVADGRTALAFARMRMSDPLGDIGRVQRQREVIAAIVDTAADPSIILRPTEVTALASAGLGSVKLDDSANIYTVARLGLAFRAASGPGGVTGTPPISSLDFRPGGIGSAVQLDPQRIDQFWEDLANGDLEPGIHPR